MLGPTQAWCVSNLLSKLTFGTTDPPTAWRLTLLLPDCQILLAESMDGLNFAAPSATIVTTPLYTQVIRALM